jgi:hypothetical protein
LTGGEFSAIRTVNTNWNWGSSSTVRVIVSDSAAANTANTMSGYMGLYLNSISHVGFGLAGSIASPQIRCNNDGTISSSATISTTSDRRLKKNIERIPAALTKVNQMNGYTYDMRVHPDMEATIHTTGLIAQEVQEVFPEVVCNVDDTYMGISYANLAGLFVEAIKELTNKVKILEDEVRALRG